MTLTLERQSTKHSPRLDDELHGEVEPLLRGGPVDARVAEDRDPEPAADGEPSPTAFPATDAYFGLGHDTPSARRELSRWLAHEAFPGDREALLTRAREVEAPVPVVAALEGLPDGTRSYHTVYDVWEALTGETERAPAGREYHGGRR